LKGTVVNSSVILDDPKLRSLFFKRKIGAHKGDFGRVLVIGGSKYYSGAPALCAMAALRTGADIATVLAPEHVANTIRGFSPNLIVREYEGTALNSAALEEFERIYDDFDSFVIGSGLSLEAGRLALHAIVNTLEKEKKKYILDADALKLLRYKEVGGKCVVTPHHREYALFFGNVHPENASKKLCILLKGHDDMVYYKSEQAVNKTGNPGMTVGGTGDVLTGVLATLLANTHDLFGAACAAAYICGSAGDLAYKEHGNLLLATDVIDFLPAAISAL
jgi:hydroxyethylthiazole kinase-like uncharacterized protein yjeF